MATSHIQSRWVAGRQRAFDGLSTRRPFECIILLQRMDHVSVDGEQAGLQTMYGARV